MRSFSGLYFLLRLAAYLPSVLSHLLSSYFYINEWFTIGTTFCIIYLFVAFAKPYRKAQMNYLDSMLLLNCHTAESSQSAITGTVTAVQPLIQPTSTVFSYGAGDN